MNLYFLFNMLRNIISTFFQDGIWVVGFFYLLLKIYEGDRVKQFSKNVIVIVMVILFIYSVIVST
ncbi:DNA integrity scanning protein DisA with diadenylate cyclase activity [Bacillus mesophilus]|nr:DNA integrity scanning protein DisA with diadenylate cyclase activity [Bacillus mesophilus]